MANRYLIRCIGRPEQHELEWLLLSENSQILQEGKCQAISELPLPLDNDEVIALLPAQNISLFKTKLPKLSGKKLQQALPYALEDVIADEVDNLTFLPGDWDANGNLSIAVIEKELLDAWIKKFDEKHYPINVLTSEIFALPYEPEKWFALADTHLVWLRADFTQGLCFDRDNFSLFITQLAREYGNPIHLILKNLTTEPIDTSDLHNINITTYYELCSQSWLQVAASNLPEQWPINFLETVTRKISDRRSARIKYYWKITAVLATIWIIIFIVAEISQFFILNRESAQLTSQIQGALSQYGNPDIDRETAKMRATRQLEQLQASAKGDKFLQIMGKIAKAWQKHSDNKIVQLNYQSSEIVISVDSPGFNQLETLVRALKAENLKVNQGNITKQGNQVRAELSIKSNQS